MALSLDRKAFIDIITEGKGNAGGVMLPPPEGIWGMPPEVLDTLPGYGVDVGGNRNRRAILCSGSDTDPAGISRSSSRPATSHPIAIPR